MKKEDLGFLFKKIEGVMNAGFHPDIKFYIENKDEKTDSKN